MADDIQTIRDCLRYIDPTPYEDWIKVGMIMHHSGMSCDDWEAWSQQSPKYKPNQCEFKWRSFRGRDGVGIGSLVRMAEAGGYQRQSGNEVYGFDDVIPADKLWWRDMAVKDITLRPPILTDTERREQIKDYLTSVFQPDDMFCFSTDKANIRVEDGKGKPRSSGIVKNVADVLEKIDSGVPLDDIFGTPCEAGGAFIRINPVSDGNGSNTSVADWRYALVECDSLPVEQQLEKYIELRLPIKLLVHSGGKSLHALVKVYASNETEYYAKVDKLYDICIGKGLDLDKQNRNPSRFSRFPGFVRGENAQYIVDHECGVSTLSEWFSWVDDNDDDTPDIISLEEMWNQIPPLKEELISGILRKGHKMLISGASKAGKSYLLIELAACIAEGLPWLGYQCKQGRVLYVNLELDDSSCWNRVKDIYSKRGIKPKHKGALDVWNLRGKGCDLKELHKKLMRKSAGREYSLIILDPIYKIETGDENNAHDMGEFCNLLDRVAVDKGTAVAYCHHHSKGGQSHKSSIDRMSGSGVFARDPDAVLDLIELYVPREMRDGNKQAAYRLECTLREFRSPEPVSMWFDWPLHVPDHALDDCEPADSAAGGGAKAADAHREAAANRALVDQSKFSFVLSEFDDPPTAEQVADRLGWSARKVKEFANENGYRLIPSSSRRNAPWVIVEAHEL